MTDGVEQAMEGWRGPLGDRWAERNPVSAEATDRSWRIRFGFTKRVLVRELLRGVVFPGATWLDLGCSAGAHANTMRAAGHVCRHGCDLNVPSMADVERAVCADARRLPYADASFDGVTTSGTLMHVGGDEGLVDTLRECDRVARHFLFFIELWQPQPLQMTFFDLMPTAWVYPWERVVPHILGTRWTLERCRLMRTCGRLRRTQPLMAMLLIREPPKPGGGRLWGEQALAAAYKDLRATSS